jgi:hypothetical protein
MLLITARKMVTVRFKKYIQVSLHQVKHVTGRTADEGVRHVRTTVLPSFHRHAQAYIPYSISRRPKKTHQRPSMLPTTDKRFFSFFFYSLFVDRFF